MIVQVRKGVVSIKHGVVSSVGKGKIVSSGLQDKMRDIEESQQPDLSGEGLRGRGFGGTLRKKGAPQTKEKLQKFINLKF
jgi:hypothetical protein